MRRWLLSTVGVLALAMVIGSILSPAQAQSTTTTAPHQVAPGYTPPKTPWGDPDLQGNLTNINEVNVSMERPKEFADRAWNGFSRREFAAIRKRQQEDAAKRRLAADGVQGGTPEIWLEAFDHTKGSVLWFITDPADGRIPPMTPQAQARQQARTARNKQIQADVSFGFQAGRAESIEDRGLYDRCISRGLPGSMMPAPYGNSYQIVQTRGYVAIRYEMVHETRIIPLDNRPHAASVHTLWMGDARGRFEGNTLVVETTNFRDELTPRGANPKTLKLIERFTRVAPDKIHWSMTFDDPDTWTRPWTQTVPLTIDDKEAIIEYACHEANYSMWNTMTGRRFEEYEALRQRSSH